MASEVIYRSHPDEVDALMGCGLDRYDDNLSRARLLAEDAVDLIRRAYQPGWSAEERERLLGDAGVKANTSIALSLAFRREMA